MMKSAMVARLSNFSHLVYLNVIGIAYVLKAFINKESIVPS